MHIVDIIIKKRNGEELTDQEIAFFVQGVKEGTIANYQISALLMAIYFQGMNDREIASLTWEMAQSGDVLDFPEIKAPIVDKHSSGGVGDKTSLIIAPIVAACGLPIAKLSGRGLGFTGGTVDKLESIPGFRTQVPMEDFINFVKRDGISLIGQSADIAPVDKTLYSLRDVTGTVDSIPLIASSIMSKKLADGSDAIVLDVKLGSGAFMKTKEDAVELAKKMVAIGQNNGKKTLALVTDMDQPLGRAVGNILEVQEALEVLRAGGPNDLKKECLALCRAMLVMGGKAEDRDQADGLAQEAIDSGQALAKFRTMVVNQGGDPAYVDDPSLFPQAQLTYEGRADQAGIVEAINAEEVGLASLALGAGREKAGDPIDPEVGLVLDKKRGDQVEAGDRLFTIYANDPAKGKEGLDRALAAYRIGKKNPGKSDNPVIARVDEKGVHWTDED